jgi:hypothetical protein
MSRFKIILFVLTFIMFLSLLVPAAGALASSHTQAKGGQVGQAGSQAPFLVPTSVAEIQKVYLPCIRNPCGPSATDNFSNPASGWLIENTPEYSTAYLSGEYQILVKLQNQVAFNWVDFGATNYRFEANARPASHLDGNLGLVFSGSLTTGFYLFQINNGGYGLWRIEMGPWAWTTLVNWTNSSAINTGALTNRLKVVRQGANITLYANNQLLTMVCDSLEAANGAANFDGRFDNLAVYTGACIDTPTAAAGLAADRAEKK